MQIVKNIEKEEWLEFLRKVKGDSIFLLPEMESFFNANKHSKACSIFVLEGEEVIGMALGEVSSQSWDFIGLTRRTIFYSEPVYNGNPDVLEYILHSLRSQAEGLFVEIRCTRIMDPNEKDIFVRNGFIFHDHLDAQIPLIDKDVIWNGFEKDKKKGIRKALEKFRLEINEKNDPEGIEIFYSLMKALYRKKRHPFKPKAYFENLLLCLGPSHARFFFVYYQGTPIATQLAFYFNQKITTLYTATCGNHLDKKAGDLVIWHLITMGIDLGYTIFDFGGGGNPNRPYGPREYKKRFGCKFVNVGRFVSPRKRVYYVIESLYRLILKN